MIKNKVDCRYFVVINLQATNTEAQSLCSDQRKHRENIGKPEEQQFIGQTGCQRQQIFNWAVTFGANL